jgi:hypothetical protein
MRMTITGTLFLMAASLALRAQQPADWWTSYIRSEPPSTVSVRFVRGAAVIIRQEDGFTSAESVVTSILATAFPQAYTSEPKHPAFEKMPSAYERAMGRLRARHSIKELPEKQRISAELRKIYLDPVRQVQQKAYQLLEGLRPRLVAVLPSAGQQQLAVVSVHAREASNRNDPVDILRHFVRLHHMKVAIESKDRPTFEQVWSLLGKGVPLILEKAGAAEFRVCIGAVRHPDGDHIIVADLRSVELVFKNGLELVNANTLEATDKWSKDYVRIMAGKQYAFDRVVDRQGERPAGVSLVPFSPQDWVRVVAVYEWSLDAPAIDECVNALSRQKEGSQ